METSGTVDASLICRTAFADEAHTLAIHVFVAATPSDNSVRRKHGDTE
jgi:hypothetical protein